MGIGPVTRNTIKRLLDEGEVEQQTVDGFFDGVRAFYTRSYNYCIQWLPLNNLFLKSCRFVDFAKRATVSVSDVEQTVASFTRINERLVTDTVMLDAVEEQLLDYQSMCSDDIPKDIWEAAKAGEEVYRMDVVWGYLKDKLPQLSEIALSVLVIPHSNAAEES